MSKKNCINGKASMVTLYLLSYKHEIPEVNFQQTVITVSRYLTVNIHIVTTSEQQIRLYYRCLAEAFTNVHSIHLYIYCICLSRLAYFTFLRVQQQYLGFKPVGSPVPLYHYNIAPLLEYHMKVVS